MTKLNCLLALVMMVVASVNSFLFLFEEPAGSQVLSPRLESLDFLSQFSNPRVGGQLVGPVEF